MPRISLPPLLFHQKLLLALLAGAVSLRAPIVGVAVLAMLVFVPEADNWRVRFLLALKIAAVSAIGFVAVYYARPEVPDKPSWAAVPRQAVLVEGQVDSVTGLAGGRVRVLLKGLRPASVPLEIGSEHEKKLRKALMPPRNGEVKSGRKSYAGGLFHDDGAILPGLVSMTLDAKTLTSVGRPLAGQRMKALVRLFPSGGSANVEDVGINAYWAAREVWHNARLVYRDRQVLFLEFMEGEGWTYAAVKKREAWRTAMTEMFARQVEGLAERNSGENVGRAPVYRGYASEPEAPAWSQGRAIISALLFGDRSGLSLRTVDLFTRAGLLHSLALSGQHLALAAMAGMLCIFLLSRPLPGVYRFWPRRALIACAGLPFALTYLFVGGAPFSLIRAALMMLAGALFLCLRRPSAPLDALFAAAFILFLGWPLAVFDLSAQLSVTAVAGIMLSMPLVSMFCERLASRQGEFWLSRWGKTFLRWSGVMIIISAAAQAAVLPILVAVFGAVSPCFWLNTLWLPPLTFVTLPLAVLGMLFLALWGPQAMSLFLFDVAAWPADVMLGLLEMLDAAGGLPFVQCLRPAWLSSLGYVTLLASAAFLLQNRLGGKIAGRSLSKAFAFGVFFLFAGQVPQWADSLYARFEDRVTLSMLDVGLGQAVLIEYPAGRILVDGGGGTSPFFDYGKSILAPALTEGHMPRLDAVIVSHADVDHARGLRWIFEYFKVGALYWSPVTGDRADSGEAFALRNLAREHGIPEKILQRGDRIELERGLSLEVLAPNVLAGQRIPELRKLSSNNASLALRLVRDSHGLALLCGDMQSSALRKLVRSGQNLQADVLVLPHHGAASSYQKQFYEEVTPRAALVSTASFSHYGFPSRKVRVEMARRNIPIFSTSELGTFSVRWTRKRGKDELDLGDLFPCSAP